MNRHRDIERVLDEWFVDGPSVMPERLFLAVLDRVDRAPQRRLSRFSLRFFAMSPRLRMLTAAAAAISIAVVGLALVNRAPTIIGPSGTPTIQPTFDTVVPAGLSGRWQSGTRATPGIDPGAGTSVLIGQGSLEFAQSNDVDRPRISSTVTAIGPNRLEVRTIEADDCSIGDTGRYAWSLSPGGRTLVITAELDGCANRQNALPGTWRLEDCPIEGEGCLGPLEAGDYQSMFFDPFVGPAESWRPRHGVLTYTVPEGWSNAADWPESFTLEPATGGGASVILFGGVVAPSDEGPCSELPSTTIQTAQQVAEWLATAPGVVPVTPAAVTIGSLDGWRVDVAMDPGWTTQCPLFSNGGPGRIILVDTPSAEGFAWSLVPGQRSRVYLLDLGDGRALGVLVDAPSTAAFDAVIQEAVDIIESFRFAP